MGRGRKRGDDMCQKCDAEFEATMVAAFAAVPGAGETTR
jgi:hypothetical protein